MKWWPAALLLALSTAGSLAFPYLEQLVPPSLARGADRMNVVMAMNAVACVLGIWQLRVALGWKRRSWRGRGLALGVIPCFILPAWIGLFVLVRPFDPTVPLVPRSLPGYRIALPDWHITAHVDEYWTGSLTLRRQPGDDQVTLRWAPAADSARIRELQAVAASAFEANATVIGEEATSVAGHEARTRYLTMNGWAVAYSVWSCGDGRALLFSTRVEKPDDSRRFQWRILESISCAPDVPPKPEFPSVSLPGFVPGSATSAGRVFTRDAETVTVSALKAIDASTLREDGFRRAMLGGILRGLQRKAAGAPVAITRVDRVFWAQSLDGGGELVLTAQSCGKQGDYWAAELGSDRAAAVDHLLAITCPR